VASKIEPKSVQEPSKIDSKSHLVFDAFLDDFLVDFCPNLDTKSTPKSIQKSIQKLSNTQTFKKPKSLKNLHFLQ